MKRGFVAPMLAKLGSADDIRDPDDWAFEMKWDGIRAVAVIDGKDVGLFTRNENDVTAGYPEVVNALAELGLDDTVLDGEIVALNAAGVPDFGRLQQRMGLTKEADVEAARRDVPVKYLVFDVMRSGGDSLVDEPYVERRKALRRLKIAADVVEVPKAFDGSLADAVESSKTLGLEGVLAKRRDSRYLGGKRATAWTKVKHQRMQEVVVAGWRGGQGRAQRQDRRAAARHPHRGRAPLCRQGRHGVRRAHAGRPPAAARQDCPQDQPVRRHPARHRPRRPLGHSATRRRGLVRGVDVRRSPAPAELARHTYGQEAAGGRLGVRLRPDPTPSRHEEISMPFKKKNFRTKLEARLDDLASQTEELRQQVVDRAPGVRDQLVDMLPDKDQLRDLRDDLFERLPDGVADKVPDKVKPKKRSKLKRVAFLGVLTGAGAAAFAAVKGRRGTQPPPEPFPAPPTGPLQLLRRPTWHRRSRPRRPPPRRLSITRIPGHARGFVCLQVNIRARQRGMPSGHLLLGGHSHDD